MFISKSEKTRLSSQQFRGIIDYLLNPETAARSVRARQVQKDKRQAAKQSFYDSLPTPQSAKMIKCESLGHYTFREMRGEDVIVEDGKARQFAISPDGSHKRPSKKGE